MENGVVNLQLGGEEQEERDGIFILNKDLYVLWLRSKDYIVGAEASQSSISAIASIFQSNGKYL